MSFQFIPNKHVEVPDIDYKEQVKLPSRDTALLVIDMQNDFVKEKGALVTPAASETVPRIAKLVKHAREKACHVIYTQDTQIQDDPEFEVWPKHCVINTPGWQIIDELEPKQGDLICRKNRYDGFYGTWLDHFLSKIWHVHNLIIVGTVSNICVLHTAASAGLRWYHVVMPADCVSAQTEFDQAMTLRQVSTLYAGKVVKSVDDVFIES